MSLTWFSKSIAVSATLAALAFGAPALAASPKVLSDSDLKLYQSAFAAVDRADFDTASAAAAHAQDKSLAGYVELEKLMHPTAYKAAYEELGGWLSRFADLTGADRVYNLAKRRRPAGAGATELRAPPSLAGKTAAAKPAAGIPAAREAFYSGDIAKAYKLASAKDGERWIAGLAAFRLRNFSDARTRFEALIDDPAEDEALRAGAAYWAARAAIAEGKPELAPSLLTAAARSPWTFYGLLAEAQLGLDPLAAFVTPNLAATAEDVIGGLLVRVSTEPRISPPGDDLQRFVNTEPRAKRAAALMQLGRRSAASGELLMAMTEVPGAPWNELAVAIGLPADVQALANLARFNPSDYPAPKLEPKNGFTLNPALVYAIVRQESRFNPEAGSRTGAVGLMQLMPDAAARAAGDDKLLADMSPLKDPAFNLRVGQDYFIWLLERGVGDDLIKAVAAYNGGPSPLIRTARQLGDDTDVLMLIESLPARETRDYVEQVMAGYWLYSRQFGEESPTLAQLASGVSRISVLNR